MENISECNRKHYHYYTGFTDKANEPPFRIIKCAHNVDTDEQIVMLQVASSWLQTDQADEMPPINIVDVWENQPSTYVICYTGEAQDGQRGVIAWQRVYKADAERSWGAAEMTLLGRSDSPYGSV